MQKLIHSGGIPTASIFTFKYINLLTISGSEAQPSQFTNNFGSVIQMIYGNMKMQGNITFAHNHAFDGGAMIMSQRCFVYLGQNLLARFIGNTAQHQGGAIYANARQKGCIFQIQDFDNSSVLYPNAVLHFVNNTGRLSGNAIYAMPIYNCYMSPNIRVRNTSRLAAIYKHIFHFRSSKMANKNHNLSTMATKLYYCNKKNNMGIIPTYPGKTLRIHLAALDAVNQTTMTLVYIALNKWNGIGKPVTDVPWWKLSHGQEVQVLSEDQECTTLNVTIRTYKNFDTACEGSLAISFSAKPEVSARRIRLHKCPTWFHLSTSSGRCECSPLLKEFDSGLWCNIDRMEILSTLTNFWVGEIRRGNTTQMVIALHCPLSMCRTGTLGRKPVLYFNGEGYIENQCLNNRTGILCGQCEPGYSIGIGSEKCMICTNWWLFSLFLYLASGILLIGTLYCLRLTLAAGTVNGIIFFTSTSFNPLLDFLPVHSGSYILDNYSSFNIWLLRLPNLSWGIGMCLYDGMTETAKVGLQLLYPLYLLVIIGGVTLVSRNSLRVSRYLRSSTVQVLVTVVHISFLTMVLLITNVFTPAYLYSSREDYRVVWARNGSLPYFQSTHKILVVVSGTIMLVFLLPYLTMLLIARPINCLKCIYHQTQAILDVFHAPYKQQYKRWFVLRLLLQIIFIVLYTSLFHNHYHIFGIISGLIMFIFTTGQAYLKPFKNGLLNILDLWLMINYAIATVTVSFFIHTDKEGDIVAALLTCNIIITLVFITFIAIIIYHILWVTGGLKKLKSCLAAAREFWRDQTFLRVDRQFGVSKASYHPIPQDIYSQNAGLTHDSFSSSAHLREPILSFDESD